MVDGEFKVFDSLCNGMRDSELHTRIEGKSIHVNEEYRIFESLCNGTHDSESQTRIEGKERMIQNYIHESRVCIFYFIYLFRADDWLLIIWLLYS